MKQIITIPEGTTIGTWKVSQELGRGGQGVVCRVKPTTTKRAPPRALKACFADSLTERARFEREIDLLKRCADEPTILQLVDSDASWSERVPGLPEFAYYVSEFCDGSLEDLQRKLGDAGARVDLFREACQAVRYLHEMEEPLIHRDIKPANFLLAQEPRRLVLADFGIARPLETDDALTQVQEVVGTQHFRAPEVTAGLPPTLRCDIFSLGRLLEWLLTGDISTDLSTRPVPRGGDLADEACVLLDAIIVKATQPVPTARYASVQELVAALPDLWLSVRPRVDEVAVSPAAIPTERQALKAAKDFAKSDDRAGWRETELELKRSYIDEVRRWRGEKEGAAFGESPEAYHAFADTLYRPVFPRLTFALGGVLSQRPHFSDQRRTMEHLLSIPDWNRGGRIVTLNAPQAVGFLFNYLHGALCCELDRFDLAIQMAQTSVAADDSDKLIVLWDHPQLVGWPQTLGRNGSHSAGYLQQAFERFDVLGDLFANQMDYHVALASYSLLLSMLELASAVDQIAGLTQVQLRERMMIDVPPMYIGLPEERIVLASRRTVGNSDVVRLVASASKTTPSALATAWPNWKGVLSRYDRGRFFDELPLGDLAAS